MAVFWATRWTGNNLSLKGGPTAQGKQGKWPKNSWGLGNFAKTQQILLAPVIDSLILTVKDIAIFATQISNRFFLESGYVCQVRFVHVVIINHVNWKKLRSDREKAGKTQGI